MCATGIGRVIGAGSNDVADTVGAAANVGRALGLAAACLVAGFFTFFCCSARTNIRIRKRYYGMSCLRLLMIFAVFWFDFVWFWFWFWFFAGAGAGALYGVVLVRCRVDLL